MNQPQATASLEPIRVAPREIASAEVVRRLLAFLQAGNIQLGEKIPSERKLAEALSVGRSVIREALKSLTLLGLIEVRQGDGTYLKSIESDLLPQSIEWGLLLGQKQTYDLVEARQHLEVVLAGLAAERRTDAELQVMRELVRQMAAASSDPDRFVAADIEFHYRVSLAAKNAALAGAMRGVQALLKVWISRVMHSAHSFEPSLEEHEAVFEAIEAGDPESARASMQRHMDRALARLTAALGQDDLAHLNPRER